MISPLPAREKGSRSPGASVLFHACADTAAASGGAQASGGAEASARRARFGESRASRALGAGLSGLDLGPARDHEGARFTGRSP